MLANSPIKQIKWTTFQTLLKDKWQQGQHLSIIGPTGTGKSYLSLRLLEFRAFNVVFGTKVKDNTLESFSKTKNYKIQRVFKPNENTYKYILWPKFSKPGDEQEQRKVFIDAFNTMFVQGAWTVYVDETYYFSDFLKLDYYLRLYWTQARSNNITLVASTQRPRDVPLLMYDQSYHLFFFRMNDEADLKRIGGINNNNSRVIRDTVSQLERHEFLYVNVFGDMVISKVED